MKAIFPSVNIDGEKIWEVLDFGEYLNGLLLIDDKIYFQDKDFECIGRSKTEVCYKLFKEPRKRFFFVEHG